ncbi:hypothetical protein A5874_000233, partial [Enterococcus faecium]
MNILTSLLALLINFWYLLHFRSTELMKFIVGRFSRFNFSIFG